MTEDPEKIILDVVEFPVSPVFPDLSGWADTLEPRRTPFLSHMPAMPPECKRPSLGSTKPAMSYRFWKPVCQIGSTLADKFAGYHRLFDEDGEDTGTYGRNHWEWLVTAYTRRNDAGRRELFDESWIAPDHCPQNKPMYWGHSVKIGDPAFDKEGDDDATTE